ncbi:hypothetical protein K501DRAFT_268565 [Backusella circina FSU 941]|nr:hypothetical protein K501DRAFT_268565 [Backusella circina FSU 941]
MANEVANLFVIGEKKYSCRNKDDSKGTNSVCGKKFSIVTKAIKALMRAEEEGLPLVCEIDERFTSKVCCLCHQQVMNARRRQVSLWGVLQCKIYHYSWDRDKNACHSIAYLVDLERIGQERPEVFSRSMPYVPSASLSSCSLESPYEHEPMDCNAFPTPLQQLNLDFADLNL